MQGDLPLWKMTSCQASFDIHVLSHRPWDLCPRVRRGLRAEIKPGTGESLWHTSPGVSQTAGISPCQETDQDPASVSLSPMARVGKDEWGEAGDTPS